jgi:ankyrin repeat protein
MTSPPGSTTRRRSVYTLLIGGFAVLAIGLVSTLAWLQFTAPEREFRKAILDGDAEKCESVILDHPEFDLNAPISTIAIGTNEFRITPLMLASRSSRIDAVEMLLAHGADPNAVDSNGNTALAHAVLAGQEEAVTVLLRSGADPNLEKAEGLATPLSVAATATSPEIVHLLARAGGDVSVRSDAGYTLTHLAARTGCIPPAVLRALLEEGAPPDAVAQDGRSPLLCAAKSGKEGRAAKIRLLLEHGANPNRRGGRDNRSALHWTARRGDEEATRMLLEAGADVNAVDERGESVLHAAAERGTAEVVRLLLEYGADATAESQSRTVIYHTDSGIVGSRIQGDRGVTPLDRARGRNDPDGREIVEILEAVNRNDGATTGGEPAESQGSESGP